jgi:orotate phosphoribosyltransferase
MGGVIIGHEVARYLDVPFLFCEREGQPHEAATLSLLEGKRAVVVEDVITTGGSVLEVGTLLQEKAPNGSPRRASLTGAPGNASCSRNPDIALQGVIPVFDRRTARCVARDSRWSSREAAS